MSCNVKSLRAAAAASPLCFTVSFTRRRLAKYGNGGVVKDIISAEGDGGVMDPDERNGKRTKRGAERNPR